MHIPYCAVNPYVLEADDGTLRADAPVTVTFGGIFNRVIGSIESSVTYNGAGFIPGRIAVVNFDGVPVAESQVDSSGRVACSFEIPVSSAGVHAINVTDGTNSLSSVFTVIYSASVRMNREAGYVGSEIILEGSGFIPGKIATVATIRRGSRGDIESNAASGVFSIPASFSGTHTVSSTDGVNTVNTTLSWSRFLLHGHRC